MGRHIFSILLSFFILVICTHIGNAEEKGQKKLNTKKHEILKVKAGSDVDSIGIITPQEASPEGPTSFAIGKDGDIYILDQLNFRIQVFKNNKRVKTIPIPKDKSLYFKDIELTPENKIVLAGEYFKEGRAEKNYIYILDSDGIILNLIKIEPCEDFDLQVINEGQFAGIWLCSQRIASLDGKTSDNKIRVPGKLSLNSKRVFYAQILGDITAVLYRSEEDSLSRWEPEVTVYFDMPIIHLLGIWDDNKGRIYFGAFLEEGKKEKVRYSNVMVVFSPDLNEIGRVKLAVQTEPHEIWRSVKVSSEGYIYQMLVDKKNIRLLRYEIIF